jgi:hypothetical protein
MTDNRERDYELAEAINSDPAAALEQGEARNAALAPWVDEWLKRWRPQIERLLTLPINPWIAYEMEMALRSLALTCQEHRIDADYGEPICRDEIVEALAEELRAAGMIV